MKVNQPILGRKGTLLLLVVLGAFPPLTIDLYLPAMPQMAGTFATSHGLVNLTLGAYMAAFAIGILFWGPLSERTGRRPILFAALAIYSQQRCRRHLFARLARGVNRRRLCRIFGLSDEDGWFSTLQMRSGQAVKITLPAAFKAIPSSIRHPDDPIPAYFTACHQPMRIR